MAESPATQQTESTGPIRRARASLAALETLDRLRRDPHSSATTADLAALRGWSGWGPLAPALEPTRTGSWQQIGERIAVLLPESDYHHGLQATYNAFYTPPEITGACWQILADLGFTGGRILEPGCGAGAFMAATPEGVPATWIGVERDPTTAAIAGLLHPGATIHNRRLEETPLPSYGMDAVLGNVPFGDTNVYDPTTPRELTANLHNYFIYRSVKALRPGAVAALVTSRYTMDATGTTARTARALISREAELLGAIRLPNDALTSGGAEPLVDILVLRRRRADEQARSDRHEWITTGPSVGGQQINTYFLANPRMVLGELAEDHAPRWGRTLRVNARADDPPVQAGISAAGREIVREAIEAGRGCRTDAEAGPITVETAPFPLRADGKKEGSFHLIDGVVHEVVEGELAPVQRPGKELAKLVALRDAVVALLDAEADHTRPDEELTPLRAEAAGLYDGYVAAHGYLNRYTLVEGKPDEDGVIATSRRRPPMGGFRRDPDFVTVLALEDFDDDTRTATKAALLTRRVNRPRARATHAATAAEAIALCRDELGRFDLDRTLELLGLDQTEAEAQLADVAFIDPATDTWAPADEYLTGNVRRKLAHAKTAAALDPRFARNVPALEAVIPADLEPEQIEANLGAPWIPATDVRDFARELLGFPVNVWHEPRTNTWSVTASRRAQESAAATTEWGTFRLNAYQLLEQGLNGKAPTVYDTIDDQRVRNQDETIAANDRLDAIAARFADWWREDPNRTDRLTHSYNQAFNAIVPRAYDGAHLTFPGLDTDFDPYPHQRDMVARMISGNDALCPYPVGTGKTATMFMAALKLKALGLASKPLIIVVPSTLEQIARDGKRLFPGARILMAGKEDLAGPRARKLFAARCAMEDWDAVVMSHSSFTSLPVHPTAKANYLTTRAAEYRSALIAAKADGAEPRKIKQIAKMVDRQETEAKALLNHATDDGVFFEHLGTDYLLVDEIHTFKNLAVPVHTDGFTINGSKRAQDLDMKLEHLRTRNPGRAVITGFTGTPVSNTLLEMFILQHYLQPRRLEELGLSSADAWASMFVRFANGVEITPDGGFRLNRRPVEIINIPDLMHTVAEFAELRPPEAFPVKRPDAHRHLVVVEASDTVRDFVHNLAERADEIRAGGVSPDQDNMLKICTDGRKVALHESLVGLEPEGAGKIDALAANVARIYHQTKDLELPGDETNIPGRLQLVFCDLGTPNKDKGTQVYGLIRQQLIASGIPAARIRFIHDAGPATARLALFDQCNKGDVSVLLGSTDKLGIGVNVQRRAVALHHVDAPWRPDQVEQREGRVWRPKNLNSDVEIYRYITQDSFDAFMWQSLERKEKALRPILAGQVTTRTVEDIGDIALDYGQIKAVATGNPMLAELSEVNVKVKSLASLAASHQRNQRRLRSDIHTLTMQASAAAKTAEALEAVAHCSAKHLDGSDASPWLDAHLNPLSVDDVPAVLGALAESTIAKGYCDGEVHWRGGLAISFTYSRNQRDGDLAARIIVGDNRHRIDVPVNLAWAAKGQHWRIRDAITTTITDAPRTAAATRTNIQNLNQRITENETATGQPFAEQAALDQARARRTILDAAIREQAQKDEEARSRRTARATAGTATGARDERNKLLRRLHAAMSAMIQPTPPAEIDATSQTAVSELSPDTATSAAPNTPPLTSPAPLADDGQHAELADVESPLSPAPATQTTQPQPHAVAHSVNETENAPVADSNEPDVPAPEVEEPANIDHEQADAEELMRADPGNPAAPPTPRTPARNTAPDLARRPAPQPAPAAARGALQQAEAQAQAHPGMFEQAVDLALQGFAVFPLKPGTKRPMFKGWEKRASTDPEQIARWWDATPTANIAIACGPSKLLVIDLDKAKRPDGPRHGAHTLTTLAAGRELPRTLTVASARGGRHLYYRQPENTPLGNTTGSDTAGLGPLIDTRGLGGFIVAPGSVFEGGTYCIEHHAAVAPLPAWITEQLTKRPPAAPTLPETTRHRATDRRPVTDRRRDAYGNTALNRSAATVANAREGTRNDTLNREAFRLGRLIGGDVLNHADAAAALRQAAHQAGLPPGEAADTITSGMTAGIGHPRYIPEPAPRPDTNHKPTKETTVTTADQQHDAATQTAQPETGNEPVTTIMNWAARTTEALPAGSRRAAVPPPETEPPAVAATTPTLTPAHETVLPPGEATAAPEAEFDFENIWNDVRAAVERARQALPDWTPLNTPDDLKPAIQQVLRHLADAPIPQTTHDEAATANTPTATSNTNRGPNMSEPAAPAEPTPNTAEESGTEDLDEHLAALDAAYAQAHTASIPTDRPEWAGINAIHSAVHNLWDTLKAAIGTYWAELSADVRIRGLLTTLATRATRAIADLASTAATHLEQHSQQQQRLSTRAEAPSLREAYINARNQIHAHAATHQWQRITALWGTVNTFARHTNDPGIRAVTARSADAIADHADSLAHKISQYGGHTGATDALSTLATAAAQHARTLRANGHDETPEPELHQTAPERTPVQPSGTPSLPLDQGPDTHFLQAKARQVAQHAQARLGQTSGTTPTSRRIHRASHSRGEGNSQTRQVRADTPHTAPNTRVR